MEESEIFVTRFVRACEKNAKQTVPNPGLVRSLRMLVSTRPESNILGNRHVKFNRF